MTHSPCSAKREFVEPDPSRSPVRTRAVEQSPLLQPRWPTPDKSGTVSVARREDPHQNPRAAVGSEAGLGVWGSKKAQALRAQPACCLRGQ